MASREIEKKYFIQKKWGETPLEAILRLRTDEHIPANIPMTYAGRLDPAAEGLLLVLVGDECKKKNEYNALSKTYRGEIIFGISTDSYDLLGIPKISGVIPARELKSTKNIIADYFKNHLGKQLQKYPPYSSKNIHTGTLPLPHEVELFEYHDLEMGEQTCEEMVDRVKKLTEIVTGDFRQEQICAAWQAITPAMPRTLLSVSLTLKVSSGFYIRQLAEDLSVELGFGGCLYSLVRTGIEEKNNGLS